MARRTKGLATPKAARRREKKEGRYSSPQKERIYLSRNDNDKLKELTFEEFIAIIPSRQRRSFKRGLSMEQAKIINDSNNKPTKLFEHIVEK